MTLSELLIVLAIMGVILAALAGVLSMSITQSSQIQEQSTLQSEVRATVDTMARELRQAYTGDSTYPIVTAPRRRSCSTRPTRPCRSTTGSSPTGSQAGRSTGR